MYASPTWSKKATSSKKQKLSRRQRKEVRNRIKDEKKNCIIEFRTKLISKEELGALVKKEQERKELFK